MDVLGVRTGPKRERSKVKTGLLTNRAMTIFVSP
ncbi:hypothetical protein LEP1GSC041_0006, partial [Leptospira noguchii str. 2006001870]